MSEDHRTYVLRRALEGANDTQIARELGITIGRVTGYKTRGIRSLEKGAAMPTGFERPTPPSRAMLALAMFDPVIAAAAEKRSRLAAA